MFTGIIQDMGRVRSVETSGDWRIVIETALDLSNTPIGASLACAGCCLTVVEKGGNWFAVRVSAETLSKTAIGGWKEGRSVNLEPALKAGDELGGHIVSGHVDGLAQVQSVETERESHRLWVLVPQNLVHFIAPKGSVALDGISLTVNEVQPEGFGVNIIPHTWTHTTLGQVKAGDRLHLEIDMLARYVARILEGRAA